MLFNSYKQKFTELYFAMLKPYLRHEKE